jgi:hypothetical protein
MKSISRTVPNTVGIVFKDIRRVADDEATYLVKNEGWTYCNKNSYRRFKIQERKEANKPVRRTRTT